jgi:hypothetical protein
VRSGLIGGLHQGAGEPPYHSPSGGF